MYLAVKISALSTAVLNCCFEATLKAPLNTPLKPLKSMPKTGVQTQSKKRLATAKPSKK